MKNVKLSIVSWLRSFSKKLIDQALDKLAVKILTVAILSVVELITSADPESQLAEVLGNIIAYTV
ncbi:MULTISPECIES: hypothetical protein [unclassified Vibrio]|uniref:hypothetical protein n=1 Tax=unclassified Vibrio TaxID=2614977 RepID=UPI0012689CBC|nr:MULTISPECIES: hypothetical protein [unclassified Vibrio]QFT35959.1 hypothetical protein FIU99_05920 [Vibrio sp. THAF64]QGM33859.1 hypothetical protein GGC04_05930 [Vibrio sp. THAF191d]QGN69361.1 hypothetical protein GGC03_05935 [Vibrio sp. THAF191c]